MNRKEPTVPMWTAGPSAVGLSRVSVWNEYILIYYFFCLLNFRTKFEELYYPGENTAIDEGMIAWRGNLSLRVYMPDKPKSSE